MLKNELEILPNGSFRYRTANATYTVHPIGATKNLGFLQCRLVVQNNKKENCIGSTKVDLYDDVKLQGVIDSFEGMVELKSNLLGQEIRQLSLRVQDVLTRVEVEKKPDDYIENKKSALAFLKKKNLLDNIDKVLSERIAGEEQNRKLLFCNAISYKSLKPLHAIVVAKSGLGKSHLIHEVVSLLPKEDVQSFTDITKSAIPYMVNNELKNKCVVFEDMITFSKEVFKNIREGQSNDAIGLSGYSTTHGHTVNNKVETHFSSLGAVTDDVKIPIDNKNRSFIIEIDSSKEQTKKVLEVTAKRYSGEILDDKDNSEVRLIRDAIRLLKPIQVINPFAGVIPIPDECEDRRRLQTLILGLINAITFLHQYQREQDEQGRVISSLEDVELAIQLCLEMFLVKSDFLSQTQRQFFEQVKGYLKEQVANGQVLTDIAFTISELRENLEGSKTSIYDKVNELIKRGLIGKEGTYVKKIGQKYKLEFDDEHYTKLKKITDELEEFVRTEKQA